MKDKLKEIAHKFNDFRNGGRKKPPLPQNDIGFAKEVLEAVTEADAHYYEVKDDPESEPTAFDELVAIRDVRDALPPVLIEKAKAAIPETPAIPKGERTKRECLRLRQKGLGTTAIADQLGITRRHVRRLVNQPA